mmetsp:Transcript_79053/g.236876  ORF Transcript_79053/g.236876 Transcript_79053/m.236876 type:complete len:97 (+) Transcript_79053:176-466(+)
MESRRWPHHQRWAEVLLLHISNAKSAWAGISTTYSARTTCMQGGGLARVSPPPPDSSAGEIDLKLVGNRPSPEVVARVVYAAGGPNAPRAYVRPCT